MDVYLTADCEIWCKGWNDLDNKFEAAFQKYIYGATTSGEFGLEYQLKLLKKHNLKCTFFVEPLFSLKFGKEPLTEIVELIQSFDQKVELHIHTEWLDEAQQKLFPYILEKRQHLKYFSRDEQSLIIATGLKLLDEAGAKNVRAFRAGSFAFNSDTLLALHDNGIFIDASFNETHFGRESGVGQAKNTYLPFLESSIKEFPMTTYNDKVSGLRHTQLTACSFGELKFLLNKASANNYEAFVFLFHNFELLSPNKEKVDRLVTRRFKRFCSLLEKKQSQMPTKFLTDSELECTNDKKPRLISNVPRTAFRIAEQIARKIYEF